MQGESPRDRLQRSLLKLSRGSRARRPARASDRAPRASGEGAVQAGVALPAESMEAAAWPAGQDAELARELASEVLERLDRIEERLADLQRPQRPIPASHEIFAEWVRLRKWEEISFGDFLRLRRSGLV